MGLRTKTLVVIGTILALMIVLISSIAKIIVVDGFTRLENNNILQNSEQALRMIDDEISHVKSVVGDWAPWDETYQFVQDVNQKYIDDNLGDSTLVNLPVDFLVYLNTDHKVVYCKYLDPETDEGGPCPDSIGQFVAANRLDQRGSDGAEGISGLAMFTDYPAIIATGPVMTSQFSGPVMGTLLAGRFLSPQEVQRLATKVNLSLHIESLSGNNDSENFSRAKALLADNGTTAVMPLNEKKIAAYSRLADWQNRPILLMGIETDRQVYAQGMKSLFYVIAAICVTGMVFIFTILMFLESKVLSRIVRLNREVQEIGKSGDLQKKTTVAGKDELAGLSNAINDMVDSVRVSTERDRAILESMEDGYFELDLEGRITFFNQALARLFDYPDRNLRDLHYRHLMNRKSAGRTFQAMKQLYASGRPITGMETGFILENGKELFLESTISLIRDADDTVTGFRGIARDVTERKKAAEELLYLAYHDALTGLFNRKAFYEHLKNELLYASRYSQQRSLLYIDLDKFKKVNDTFGHAAGDRLLKEFTGRVIGVLRNADRFFRIGGDEFVIVLSEPQAQSPEVVAERVLELMEVPFIIDSKRIDFVSASIGISVFPGDGTDIDTLLLRADNSMYKVKANGGAGLVSSAKGRKG